ncbi:MAG: hypothetical protein A3J93_01130 [Candidatus Magasanikbacteria bacterium RIFOXYC2_FULL_42_28]|uniref:Glycosyl transferase family 11 n=1 Tax=Candidatus Magasanikbacteria bacterium RIFOXYC2_FULL_42_28 TaxID=1798704 RepID=A0A1F6NXM5_9BACT|nr:MAG: hypothetical protein A3J93_01130 [Candidatus Magasanikbacteria bacterium RIFOXYC2_FULL_42_28]
MIIVKLSGGLGNQMFQYAAGRALADRHGVPLKIDASYYDKEDIFKRKYALGIFNITAEPATAADLAEFKFGKTKGLIERFKPYYKRKIVREQSFGYDVNFNKIGSNARLDGYWQSEKYFKPIESIIRNEFTPKLISQKMSELAAEIKSVNSVAVHVRRADYINFKHVNAVHGVCPADYYRRALGQISRQVTNPRYYIFTDDQEWVRQNLALTGQSTIVSALGFNDWAEMILMSKCRHDIIANSSFSWWGAWLNNNSNKIVIAPKKWFTDQSINTNDLIPGNCIKI